MAGGNLLQSFGQGMLVVIPLVLSLSVHEYAHAWVARWLGDTTAARLGRLTLNPLAHIDPLGSIMLPLGLLMARGSAALSTLPLIGWAKPVPVNAGNFRRSISVRRGMMWVAMAGPLSNLLLAAICALGFSQLLQFAPTALHAPLGRFCISMLLLNTGLCIFNLLPIGMLDGGKVVAGLLPPAQSLAFERFNARFGTWILFALVISAQRLLALPVEALASGLLQLFGGLS